MTETPATVPYTGQQFLDSLDDGREVWIYGERVGKITEHVAFRNCARMLARLYDALHADRTTGRNVISSPTEWGGFTHRYFQAPTTVEQQVRARDAMAAWARVSYGWLGRSPDYKAAFLATLGANAEFYAPYESNARRWYRYAQERVPFVNHAIIHPPIDRHVAPGAPGGATDVCVRATKETDGGIYVSGAKVVATGSALTHFTFVAHHGLIPVQDPSYACVFMVPTNAAGVKLICRVSNEARAAALGSPFDYPLSSRFDENDAVFVLDNVFVPWEDVFVYRDVDKANNFFPRTGFHPRAMFHGCTRLAVKLDFIVGLLIKATELTGARSFRGVEANIGEVIAWRNMIWGLSDAMAKGATPWTGGALLPATEPAAAYQVLAPEAYRANPASDRKDSRQRADLPQLTRQGFQESRTSAVLGPLPARIRRRGCDGTRQADEALMGCGGHRVRRPTRAVPDQLQRQPRRDPPLCLVRRSRIWRLRSLQAIRGLLPGRVQTPTDGRRPTSPASGYRLIHY